MSERKNHLTIDGGVVKDDEHVASYKPIPEADTDHEIEYIEADGEYVQMNGTEVMETDLTDDTEDIWEHASIKTMLKVYLQNKDKFRNPKIKKKSIWNEISNAVCKGPDSCDRKFRNMKQTYIRLLKKKNKEGEVNVKWPYFDVFEEIYSDNGEYQTDIQMKLQDSTTDSVAKALLSFSTAAKFENPVEHGETSQTQSFDSRRKLNRKRYAEFRKATSEMRDRQRAVEDKLDKLISIVEESNNIQKERNRLFEQFLNKLQQNS